LALVQALVTIFLVQVKELLLVERVQVEVAGSQHLAQGRVVGALLRVSEQAVAV
jgi:hypothetical protein